jgi:HAD superfamily hydrolase (TIGR01549 family)
MKILFTSIGRRVELVQSFKTAANKLNVSLEIYGTDISNSAPALLFCDRSVIIPKIKNPEYIPVLIKICKDENIDLLIPTIDTDLLLLAENKNKFGKTKVLISEPEKIIICRDKNNTADFFESCGLKAPRTINNYLLYQGPYPCFIKPKDGSSSINAFKVEKESELKVYAQQISDYVIQPFIEGTEYTVDIFCDFNGKPISIIPRIRQAVRAGEVLKTEIAMDKKIINECRLLINKFKPCGPMTVQLIRQKETENDYFIEINPRFGGGAPLSMKAGARSAEAIIKILAGEEVEYSDSVDDGAVYSRFDQSVCTLQKERKQPIKGIIFDLDDTLYSEKEYIKSGFKAVACYLGNEKLTETLWNYFERGKPAIDSVLSDLGCDNKKAECLEVYREHEPVISTYPGVMKLIQGIKEKGLMVGIITDGRVSGQKKKIYALGLDKIIDEIIVTDELGGIQFRKPCDIAFRIMQNKWQIPFEQIVYIGDNAKKDFNAPMQLGMQSIWFQNEEGLYKNNITGNENIICIKNFDEIEELLL